MLTPLTLLQRDVPPAHVELPRPQNDFEFLWLLSGSLRYTAMGAPIDVTPDMLLFRRPGLPDLLEFSPTQTSRTLAVTFALDPRSLPPGFPPPESWPSLRLLPRGDILRPLFRHLLTHRDALDYQTDPPLIEATLSLMFHIFVAGRTRTFDAPRPITPESVRRTIAFVRRVIATEPSRRVTNREFHAASGLRSAAYGWMLFKRATGLTARRYLFRARVDLAVRLLRETDWPIAIVAATTGFANDTHLRRYIIEHYGCQPTDIRRQSSAGLWPPLAPLVDLDFCSDDPFDEQNPDPELARLPAMIVPRNYHKAGSNETRIRTARAMYTEMPRRRHAKQASELPR